MTPIKHGLYSKYQGALIGDRIKELVDDPDLLDMRKHIAVLIGLEQNFLAKVEETGVINAQVRKELRDIEDSVTKAIERYNRATDEGVPKVVQIFIDQVVQIANVAISDPRDRRRFNEAVSQVAFGESGNDRKALERGSP